MFHRSIRLTACIALVALGITGVTAAGAISSSSTKATASKSTPNIASAGISASGQINSFNGSSQAVPAMPSTSASISAWQSWVTTWNDSLSVQGIRTSLEEAGCSVSNVEVTPIPVSTALALGYPAGIDPDGGSVIGDCSHATSQERLRPMSTPGGGFSEGTVGGIGDEEVETCTVNSAPSVCSFYYYGASYPLTITGHAELSTDGATATTCSVGQVVQNSSNASLEAGQFAEAFDPHSPTGSNVWNGNFWTPDSAPYTNEGNICAAI
jgi:hypothetical protein